jgi:hypothetical protein
VLADFGGSGMGIFRCHDRQYTVFNEKYLSEHLKTPLAENLKYRIRRSITPQSQ